MIWESWTRSGYFSPHRPIWKVFRIFRPTSGIVVSNTLLACIFAAPAASVILHGVTARQCSLRSLLSMACRIAKYVVSFNNLSSCLKGILSALVTHTSRTICRMRGPKASCRIETFLPRSILFREVARFFGSHNTGLTPGSLQRALRVRRASVRGIVSYRRIVRV